VMAGALYFAIGFGTPAYNPPPNVIPAGSLTAVDDFHDFGRISMGAGLVTRAFLLRNNNGEPALIRKVFTS